MRPSVLFLSYSGFYLYGGKKRQFIAINLMFFIIKLMFIRKTSFLPPYKTDVPPSSPLSLLVESQRGQLVFDTGDWSGVYTPDGHSTAHIWAFKS